MVVNNNSVEDWEWKIEKIDEIMKGITEEWKLKELRYLRELYEIELEKSREKEIRANK